SAWYRIQDLQSPFANYFRESPPDLTVLKATLLDALILTLVFAVLYEVSKRLPQFERAWHCTFLGVVIIGLEVARIGWTSRTLADNLRNAGVIAAEVALAAGILLRVIWGNPVMVRATGRVLLLFNFLFLALALHFVSSWFATPAQAEFRSDKA